MAPENKIKYFDSVAYQRALLRAIRSQMTKASNKRTTNIMLVRDTLLLPTSNGGRTSAYEHCQWLGIDSEGFTS